MLAVINNIHWYVAVHAVNCYKLLYGQPPKLLIALHQSSTIDPILVENRDFCLLHLHSTPSLGRGSVRILPQGLVRKKQL